MDRKKLFEGSLVILMIFLISIVAYGIFNILKNDKEPEIQVVETVKPTVSITEYKYYKLDNLSFGFILADVKGDNIETPINIDSLKTSEDVSLSSFESYLDTMREVGYKVDQIDRSQQIENGNQQLFIPVLNKDMNSIKIDVDSNNTLNFELSNPVTDQNVFGYEKQDDKNNEESEPTNDDVVDSNPIDNGENKEPIIDNEDPTVNPVDVKDSKNVEIGILREVDPQTVLIKSGDNYEEVGYPSNMRIVVVPVKTLKDKVFFESAKLSFKDVDQIFTAVDSKLQLSDSKELNMINNTSSTSGVLIFEINAGEFDIEQLQYNLTYDLSGGE